MVIKNPDVTAIIQREYILGTESTSNPYCLNTIIRNAILKRSEFLSDAETKEDVSTKEIKTDIKREKIITALEDQFINSDLEIPNLTDTEEAVGELKEDGASKPNMPINKTKKYTYRDKYKDDGL
ncbi:hypothetical protein [Desulforegula conservatrix]|uniref:hypothetical protein n=1 Tax=Desulforegula conservatrix TaxID=153026 RepID=UPI000402F8BA|nr:hypothetical protein [Desulforegula conservatrix]